MVAFTAAHATEEGLALWTVVYEDDDEEQLTLEELQAILLPGQASAPDQSATGGLDEAAAAATASPQAVASPAPGSPDDAGDGQAEAEQAELQAALARARECLSSVATPVEPTPAGADAQERDPHAAVHGDDESDDDEYSEDEYSEEDFEEEDDEEEGAK